MGKNCVLRAKITQVPVLVNTLGDFEEIIVFSGASLSHLLNEKFWLIEVQDFFLMLTIKSLPHPPKKNRLLSVESYEPDFMWHFCIVFIYQKAHVLTHALLSFLLIELGFNIISVVILFLFPRVLYCVGAMCWAILRPILK